jgi:hypothetical protein
MNKMRRTIIDIVKADPGWEVLLPVLYDTRIGIARQPIIAWRGADGGEAETGREGRKVGLGLGLGLYGLGRFGLGLLALSFAPGQKTLYATLDRPLRVGEFDLVGVVGFAADHAGGHGFQVEVLDVLFRDALKDRVAQISRRRQVFVSCNKTAVFTACSHDFTLVQAARAINEYVVPIPARRSA